MAPLSTFTLMRLLLLLVLIFPLTATAQAQTPLEAGTLRVVVTGMKSDAGAVRVALFDSEAAFTRTSADAAVLTIADGQAVWTVDGLSPGRYAVAAFHDEDGDGEMGRGLFSIPSEPYGFSRGARGRFGPPKWKDASIAVGADTVTTHVRVR